MKNSFHIAILAIALLMVAGIASAESVNIGLGAMDRTEFETLRQMVNGEQSFSMAIQKERPADTYVGEFNWKEVEGFRQSMAFGGNHRNETFATSNGQVDIGLGTMSTNEFCDLNKLVASNSGNAKHGFGFVCP